jgi:ACS family D-galactonate transporter-like MFS transporter
VAKKNQLILGNEEGFVEKKGSFHWAWIILATCFVNFFVNYSVRQGYGVILPEMIKDLGLSRTQGGSIFNAYLFCYIALTPLTGHLTDRLGARRVVTACAFILGCGLLLMGTVGSFWKACLSYAIVGLGATGMWTPILTVVQRWFAFPLRGRALGVLSTGYGLGLATMGLVFPWIVKHFSWHYSWYFFGVGALLMGVADALLLRSDPESTGYLPWGQKGPSSLDTLEKEKHDPKTSSPAAVFKNRIFWLVGLSYFSVSCALYGFTTFMVDYARHQMGLPLEKASFLATIHGTCQILGVLTILPLSDYLGRRNTILISNAFIAACLIGILSSGHSWPMLFVFTGILAIFYGVTFPMYGVCAGDYFPKRIMGTVIGAWTPFYGLGAIVAHWVGGILRDTTGSYHKAYIFSTAMAVLGVVLISTVKKSPK